MKSLLILLVLGLLLVGCSPAPADSPVSAQASQPEAAPTTDGGNQPAETAPVSITEGFLTTDYADATSLRNQLAFGTMKLEGTEHAVTAEQAQTLLPFWQAILSLSGDSNTVSEEVNAVQDQIIEYMQPEQLQAIAAMQISNADLTAFYAEKGIVLPTPLPGVTREPGKMKDLPEEAREATKAARQASGAEGSGAGQVSRTLLFEEVVKLLAERAGQ